MRTFILALALVFLSAEANSQYSHDVIVETLLRSDTTSIGQRIVYPSFQRDEVTISRVTIPPGKSTGWHKHKFPVFAYVLQGTVSIEVENHGSFQFAEHSSFSEVIDTFHNGVNKGNENVVLLAFFMGEKGAPLSVRRDTLQSTTK
ncbi:MAG: cupin domain-containing protein [Ignavibacteriales bacterium]|nr:cupin domain-containing protein [Ignavibacteriales bacterium]